MFFDVSYADVIVIYALRLNAVQTQYKKIKSNGLYVLVQVMYSANTRIRITRMAYVETDKEVTEV